MRSSVVHQVRVGVLTISDLGFAGDRADASGDAVVLWAVRRGHEIVIRSLVPDEQDRIAGKLARWADSGEVDLILTTGGTGLAPRDVTPEATASVLEREAPGVVAALRAAAGATLPRAWLSRGLAGTRGATLIVNLPGSPAGVKSSLKTLDGFVDHAVEMASGRHVAHDDERSAGG